MSGYEEEEEWDLVVPLTVAEALKKISTTTRGRLAISISDDPGDAFENLYSILDAYQSNQQIINLKIEFSGELSFINNYDEPLSADEEDLRNLGLSLLREIAVINAQRSGAQSADRYEEPVYSIAEVLELLKPDPKNTFQEVCLNDNFEKIETQLQQILEAYRNNRYLIKLVVEFADDLEFITSEESLFDPQQKNIREIGIKFLTELAKLNAARREEFLTMNESNKRSAGAASSSSAAMPAAAPSKKAKLSLPPSLPRDEFLELFVTCYCEKCTEFVTESQDLPEFTAAELSAEAKEKFKLIIAGAYSGQPINYILDNPQINSELLQNFIANANADNFPLYSHEEFMAAISPKVEVQFRKKIAKFIQEMKWFKPYPDSLHSGPGGKGRP